MVAYAEYICRIAEVAGLDPIRVKSTQAISHSHA